MDTISFKEAMKAVRFVRHIEAHLKTFGSPLEVCCKICDMTIEEINEEYERAIEQ